MSEQHTPGKLETDGRSVYTVSPEGGMGTNVAYCGSAIGRDTECDANAHRIAACWNRLLPFSTEEIEQGIDLSPLQTELERALALNERLLACLEEMVGAFQEQPDQASALSAAELLLEELKPS